METNTSRKQEVSSDRDTKSRKAPRKKKKNVLEVAATVRRKPSSTNYVYNLAREEAAGGYGGLENFKIPVADGHLVLPDHLRMAYGTLCYARNGFLHTDLPKDTCPALVLGMIEQTAKIAEGIMDVSPDSLEDLASWSKTLGAFESQGMDVAFMRDRVDELIAILSADPSSSPMEEPEGYEKLKLERDRVVENMRALKSRIFALKDALRKIDMEIEKMDEMVEVSAEKRDQAVRKLATAPW